MSLRVHRTHAGQAGQSLIEALIALTLASSIIIILALALQTSTIVDGQTNAKQRLGLAVSTLTETLRQVDYEACDGGATAACTNDLTAAGGVSGNARSYRAFVQAAVDGDPAKAAAVQGITWKVTDVKYWQAVSYSGGAPIAGGTYASTFNATSDSQLIKFEVEVGGTTLRASVVKRFPGALSRFSS